MKALFAGFIEVDQPAVFKEVAMTAKIGGQTVPTLYTLHPIKNADDFIAGEWYDIEINDGVAVKV